VNRKIIGLQERMDQLEGELDVMREQSRLVIQRTYLGYLNQFYVNVGMAMVLPRSRTFPFPTDTGLGAFVGAGQYLGRNHVVALSLDWDVYPSLSVRYRYEFHSESPSVAFGPVVGFKTRALPLAPFDNFLDRPKDVKASFWFFGAMVGLPLGRAMLSFETLYLTNQQSFLFANLGLHLFFGDDKIGPKPAPTPEEPAPAASDPDDSDDDSEE